VTIPQAVFDELAAAESPADGKALGMHSRKNTGTAAGGSRFNHQQFCRNS
jgi:hypothetical protein